MKQLFLLLGLIILVACSNSESKIKSNNQPIVSLLGDTLIAAAPSAELMGRYEEKKEAYEEDSENLENIIWYGRFTAYIGNYRDAIDIYSEGLKIHRDNPRLLRHRGHRYITVRDFDNAVKDLTIAASFIEGTPDKVEADGMPNERNIPVSTLHGNIYYHLGLAHYLQHNPIQALNSFKKSLKTSGSPDNVVSSTHWIYMTIRNMGQEQSAQNFVANITADMDVIENTSYHKACLFYKGELELKDVYDPNAEESASRSALNYAVGNWYKYNGRKSQANGIFNKIVSGSDWASFGYIAAEAELAR